MTELMGTIQLVKDHTPETVTPMSKEWRRSRLTPG